MPPTTWSAWDPSKLSAGTSKGPAPLQLGLIATEPMATEQDWGTDIKGHFFQPQHPEEWVHVCMCACMCVCWGGVALAVDQNARSVLESMATLDLNCLLESAAGYEHAP